MSTKTKAAASIAQSQLVRAALKFWFADSDHIRSPFPSYVQVETQKHAVARFSEWLGHLNEKAKDDINEEILAEKFEEILFEEGLKLVETVDERITLLYPFLPRIHDPVNASTETASHPPSVIVARSLSSEGDTKFLKLQLQEKDGSNQWETKMELPA